MGFCGVDDSVNAEMLQLLSIHYTWIEWGVLFRPDKEGTPRYATFEWVENLCKINKETGGLMRLAGHLCGSRCQDILEGDFTFVQLLHSMGFGRIQINATAANNVLVDNGKHSCYIDNIMKCMKSVPNIEWIIQCNDETKPIWESLVVSPFPNMSILYDASCGLGKLISTFPEPHNSIRCGYAGGIGPDTIDFVLSSLQDKVGGVSVWIDMESSLRSEVMDKNNVIKDVFSIEKAFTCILIGKNKFHLPCSRLPLLSI